ncbi:tyrosine phosphatase family protein [Hansschlegelia zhihuaiae]|uniref:Protein-tyrosine-phosphatase n=1 Tax=Hansschlegelia zhihuaiae TaxID=405005 RepID=A0A4Q0MJ07_9HYPH|nr:protein-tyrosine-phosphatase [Hansschlegelia zhihuaiae]RXF73661.1 protein-tyrosine-phosphatase [Hansschlegelia zhihuaiae]
MKPEPVSLHTVCGIEELGGHSDRSVAHVLSLLDPGTPEPEAFSGYGGHRRVTLQFHDIIEPRPGLVAPSEEHVVEILRFGEGVEAGGHLLIHCHMGISRSTAAMAMLLAQAQRDADEREIVARLHELRRQAWPNARMIAMADRLLGRDGRLSEAVRRLHAKQLRERPGTEAYMRAVGRAAEVDAALAA